MLSDSKLVYEKFKPHLSRIHCYVNWIVVMGISKITIGMNVSIISEHESVYLSMGAIHRLENSGVLSLILSDVQTGSYLGKDDIL